MAHFPKPAEGSWTEHYEGLGTGPVNYSDSYDREYWEKEQQAVFMKSWLNVGRVEQLGVPIPPAVLVAQHVNRLVGQFATQLGQQTQCHMRQRESLRLVLSAQSVEFGREEGPASQLDQPDAGGVERRAKRLGQGGNLVGRDGHRQPAYIIGVPRQCSARRERVAVQRSPRIVPCADWPPKRPQRRQQAPFEMAQPLARVVQQLRIGHRRAPRRGGSRGGDNRLGQMVVKPLPVECRRHVPDRGRNDQRPKIRAVSGFVGSQVVRPMRLGRLKWAGLRRHGR